MNTSRKTKLICEGLALYAAYQDLPSNKIEGSQEAKAWNEWAWNNKQWSAFVMSEQNRLFDVINSRL